MIHVDDLLFAGNFEFWSKTFLPAMTSKFNVSHIVLTNDGSSITFLKRRLVKLSDGILIVTGTTSEKVVAYFERFFGPARAQTVCDAGI